MNNIEAINIPLTGRIDSNNAAQVEQDIFAKLKRPWYLTPQSLNIYRVRGLEFCSALKRQMPI